MNAKIEQAVKIVSEFLEASMAPDPIKAATYMSDNVKITFTGRREMANATEITAFNKSRYEWVKKSIKQYDAVEKDDHCVVYSIGYLYGQWPDGRAFHGNRYTDRFEVKNDLITKMDVLNDSAEWILEPSINRAVEE
ncbi:nuclear transport factor 2-like protein [Marinomonas epiphytica]